MLCYSVSMYITYTERCVKLPKEQSFDPSLLCIYVYRLYESVLFIWAVIVVLFLSSSFNYLICHSIDTVGSGFER